MTPAPSLPYEGAGPDIVAPALLGWTVSTTSADGIVTVRLTEVEAYAGADDPASHAYRGPTPRNATMFGRAGLLYVYRSHGLHWCANVVTGGDGLAQAVLLRAGEVVAGHALARERRGPRLPDHRLARGPGCLAQALGLTGDDDGADLLAPASRVRLEHGEPPPVVARGPRVGVARAADVTWRFWAVGDPSVSAYRRSPRAPAAP